MPRFVLHVAVATFVMLIPATAAVAHCFVGARFFPATLNTDDPCVADEMSLPTISYSKTGDVPPAEELDLSAEISKRITEDFGVSIGSTWTQIRQPGGPTVSGFQDLETTFQYQLYKNGPHELALMLGLIVDWGGTGASDSGLGTTYSTLSPTFYIGKGLGDLPDAIAWARPFGVTAEISYDIPSSSFDFVAGAPIAQTISYSGSLQYSLPYLKSNVIDLGLPDFFNHLIPIVEAQFTTPVANNFGNSNLTTGTVNPGVIWVGTYYQVGVEAVVPINRDSGAAIGAMAQLHLYLDDMFPATIGRPLLGSSAAPAKPILGN